MKMQLTDLILKQELPRRQKSQRNEIAKIMDLLNTLNAHTLEDLNIVSKETSTLHTAIYGS